MSPSRLRSRVTRESSSLEAGNKEPKRRRELAEAGGTPDPPPGSSLNHRAFVRMGSRRAVCIAGQLLDHFPHRRRRDCLIGQFVRCSYFSLAIWRDVLVLGSGRTGGRCGCVCRMSPHPVLATDTLANLTWQVWCLRAHTRRPVSMMHILLCY